jgi:hypothetical protein
MVYQPRYTRPSISRGVRVSSCARGFVRVQSVYGPALQEQARVGGADARRARASGPQPVALSFGGTRSCPTSCIHTGAFSRAGSNSSRTGSADPNGVRHDPVRYHDGPAGPADRDRTGHDGRGARSSPYGCGTFLPAPLIVPYRSSRSRVTGSTTRWGEARRVFASSYRPQRYAAPRG